VLFERRRGQRQPSQWCQDTYENSALWWLGFGIRPSRSGWYEFRARAGSCIDTLNAHLLHQAVDEALTTGERGAWDGSAIAAHASRRRLLNAERLQQRWQQLAAVRQDDAPGRVCEGVAGWMAKTPQGRTPPHHRYEQAQAQLAMLQATNAQRPAAERRAPERLMLRPGAPQAALGLDKEHVFRPLYTGQTLRAVNARLILGYEVLAQASDAATLPAMLRRSAHRTGRHLQALLVDSGSVTGHDLADCAAQGVTLYGPWKENDVSRPTVQAQLSKDDCAWHPELDADQWPAGHLLKRAARERRVRSGGREVVEWRDRGDASTCQAGPRREQWTTSQQSGRSLRRSEHEDLIVAHRAWMETDEAKMVYRLRGQTSEIVCADVKEHRGLRRFSGRGLGRARTELALEVLLHNLLVFHRSLSQRHNAKVSNSTTENIAA
jgi:Transposase DDE domain